MFKSVVRALGEVIVNAVIVLTLSVVMLALAVGYAWIQMGGIQ